MERQKKKKKPDAQVETNIKKIQQVTSLQHSADS